MLSEELRLWNKAVLDVFYSEASAGELVYLDMDDVSRNRLESKMGGQSLDNMVRAVRAAINFAGSADFTLDEYRSATHIWYDKFKTTDDFSETPPMLAFLAVTVMAAEKMGEGEANSNAYYTQLFEILELPEQPAKFRTNLENAYRQNIVYLWATFNSWLSAQGGRRGFPTAYAVSHPYASIPLSQALLKTTDRLKLVQFFDFFRLQAGITLDSESITTMFSAWLSKESSNVGSGLRGLWAKGSTRTKIAELIVEELAAWDGTFPGQHLRHHVIGTEAREQNFGTQRLRLVVSIRNRLGKKSLQYSLAAKVPMSNELELPTLKLEATGAELDLTRLSESTLALSDPSVFGLSTILSSKIIGDISPFGRFQRDPRQLVALALDDSTGTYQEVDRVSYGQDAYVLVRNDANLAQATAVFLERNAEPGFEYTNDIDFGIPAGWSLFSGVQIISSELIENRAKFEALIPLTETQLLLNGGVRLPSYRSQTKWLTSHPPLIRAVSRGAKPIRVEVRHLNQVDEGAGILAAFESPNGNLTQSLESVDLDDGEYAVVLVEDNKQKMTKRMMLKSTASPDAASMSIAKNLGHAPSIQGNDFLFSSVEVEGTEDSIIGAISRVPLYAGVLETPVGDSPVNWRFDDLDFGPQSIALPEVDTKDCAFTGEHTLTYPVPKPGQRTVVGSCRLCGIERLEFVTWPGLRRKTNQIAAAAESLENIPRMNSFADSEHLDWSAVRAVLGHAVGGKTAALRSAFSTLLGASQNLGQIMDGLEQLGLIEVLREARGHDLEWRLVDPQLVQPLKDSDSAFVLGVPSPDLMQQIKAVAESSQVEVIDSPAKLLVQLKNVTSPVLESLASATGMPLVLDAATKLAQSLPPLSEYMRTARRASVHSVEYIYKFDFDSGLWVETDGLPEGAIKSGSSGRMAYYFSTRESVQQGQAIPGSATLVKYLAANQAAIPLVRHNKAGQCALAPLGARVPGLYARPLLLCSGELDTIVKLKSPDGRSSRRAHKYSAVPKDLSDLIASLLTN